MVIFGIFLYKYFDTQTKIWSKQAATLMFGLWADPMESTHFLTWSILLQENSVISGQTPQPGNGNGHGVSRPGSISRASAFAGGETNSNAYATINKLPLVTTASRRRSLLGLVNNSGIDNGPDRDYATLEKMSPRSPPGPIVPGVHSSTPLGGIARRFSNDFATGSRANLIINQNGEPELVADLM